MPFDDLDQQLQKLGYGNQWQVVQQDLALRQQAVNLSDIERIKQHNRLFPQKHRQAKARWARNRFQQIKERIGKQKCLRCFKKMESPDLIGQNRLKGHCRVCRKELLK